MKNKFMILMVLLITMLMLACSCEDKQGDGGVVTVPDTEGDSGEITEEVQELCEHTFGEWEIKKQPTCKEEGVQVRACFRCSVTEEMTVQCAEEHTPVADAAVAATCKATGLTEGSHCSVCDKIIVEQTVIPKTEDHSSAVDAAVPATCKATGLTEGSHCSVCNTVLVAQAVVPKLQEHSYVNGYCSCGMTVVGGELLQASEGLVFEAASEGYSLAGIGACTDEFLIIPTMYNGKPVVKISDFALMSCNTVKKVFIPSTVVSIGKMAFMHCSSMKEVFFAEGSQLTTIGEHAFHSSGIVSVTLPEGVKAIKAAAFHSCKDLKEITLPSTLKTVGGDAFRYSSALAKVCIRDVGAWCQISFEDRHANPAYIAKGLCTESGEPITLLIIPEGITYISAFAFYEVKTIEKISFPSTLRYVYKDAFYGIGTAERHISDLAAWCKADINSATTLPSGKLFLNGNEVVDLVIPNTVTSIGAYAFSGVSSIKALTVHDGVTSIGTGAFRSCKSLETVKLSSGLAVLPKELFYGCTALKSVAIPQSTVKIDEYAFYSCSSLSSVTIPSAITYIGRGALDGCTGLEELVFECSQGWSFVYESGTATISSASLQSSSEAIKMINKFNYGYWQRA